MNVNKRKARKYLQLVRDDGIDPLCTKRDDGLEQLELPFYEESETQKLEKKEN